MSPQSKTFIVGLGGPSCTGKTSVASRLASKLGAATLSMESYYNDLSHLPPEVRSKQNFDSPEAIDIALLTKHVRDFSLGNSIEEPIYDFAQHTRVTGRTQTIRHAPVLIVEGILVLHWFELRSMFDVSIYLDAPDDVSFHRRRVRDIVERQRSREYIMEQYQNTVLPMAQKYIYPTKRHASVVIDSQRDLSTVSQEALAAVTTKMSVVGK